MAALCTTRAWTPATKSDTMYFDELDLNDNVLDALYDMRFDKCTPVQEKCIPEILEGKDLLGVAQTGTGKTAAYLLPILSKLADGGYPKEAINCVIMSPTRELAQQIDQAMQGFSYYLDDVSSVAIYGGNDGNRYDQELKSLSLGADVVIATPGRLISHISMGNADFSKVSFFILDEADRMLDMGFSEDIKKIAQLLPPTCQTIMFSATMPDKIEDLAKTLLKDPVVIKLAVSKPAEKIKQSAYVCYETQKLAIIQDIFKQGDLKRVIIFSGKKQKVKAINRALMRMHVNSGEMHSDLDQAERDQMLYKFKSGQIDVLVATDILARGIDIDDIAMVINFDVPHDAEDYVHRIGRTARADRDGVAITFINEEDVHYFKQIEKLLEKEVEKTPLPEELGEGPEYKEGRGQRTSAKSRRRKDRDATAHKRKPRNNENERKPKQPKQPKATEGDEPSKVQDNANTDNADNAQASNASDKGQEAQADGKKKRSRRRGGNKQKQDSQAEAGHNADVKTDKQTDEGSNDSKANDKQSEGNAQGNGDQERKPRNRRNRKPRGNANDAQNDAKQSEGRNAKQEGGGNGKKDGNANGKPENNRNGKKEGGKGPKKEGKTPDNADKKGQGQNKPRRKKQRPARSQDEAMPTVSTKYNKTAGMSPVVNPSKDSALKQILKKPLSWIKKLGK